MPQLSSKEQQILDAALKLDPDAGVVYIERNKLNPGDLNILLEYARELNKRNNNDAAEKNI